MADLDPLIRLRRHGVEEKQKVVAELYRQAEKIEDRKNELRDQLQAEREALEHNENLEAQAYYGRFAEVIRRNIDRLDFELRKMETRIQIAQEDMRAAFADLKRVEIVQRRRDEAEKDEEKSREARELDEIGLEVFRRQEND